MQVIENNVGDASDVPGATVNGSTRRELSPSPAPAIGGYMAMIEKLATNPTAQSVEVIERMMNLQVQWETRQAEKEFNEALARIAQKMPRITKEKGVNYTKEGEAPKKDAFKYATYETIDKLIRPLLVEEGLSLSYNTETREGGGAVVTATLSHKNGHSRRASIPVPLDTSGGKNNIQGMGSTYSYGRRYTMGMLLNIITVGEDDDGAGGAITDEQAVQIKDGLRETDLNVVKFLKAMKAETVEEIRTKEFPRALAAIENKRYANKKNGAINA